MTETALEFVWYMINKAVAFVFDAQILPGVTIGSFLIAMFIFGLVLNTLLRVPLKFHPPVYTDSSSVSRTERFDKNGILMGYSISRSSSSSKRHL